MRTITTRILLGASLFGFAGMLFAESVTPAPSPTPAPVAEAPAPAVTPSSTDTPAPSLPALETLRPPVVVEPFVNHTKTTAPSLELFKSRLENEIINTHKFTYLERGEALNTALQERQRITAGLAQKPGLPAEQAKTVAPLLAAGYAIYGDILTLNIERHPATVAVLKDDVTEVTMEVQLRYANVETGEVLVSKIVQEKQFVASNGPEGFSDQTLNEMVTAIAKKAVGALLELAYPARVLTVTAKRNQFIVNLSQEQTAIDKLYDIYSEGEKLFDPDTQEYLGTAEQYIGRAIVIRSLPKMAFLTPVGELSINAIEKNMFVREVTEETLKRERRQKRDANRQRHELRF